VLVLYPLPPSPPSELNDADEISTLSPIIDIEPGLPPPEPALVVPSIEASIALLPSTISVPLTFISLAVIVIDAPPLAPALPGFAIPKSAPEPPPEPI